MEKGKTKGIVIGKFMPPHKGHNYLIDFAKHYADELSVLVCTLNSEPIPGKLRYDWMKQEFADVDVVHVTDENPSYPEEHPEFWTIWKNTIEKAVPGKIDYVFAGEEYGRKLAELIGAKFVPLDHGRTLVPVSGTEIRNKPMKNWDYILPAARPHFLKRVCIFGPESTGKSTLAEKLAKHFGTVYVNEYARVYLAEKKKHIPGFKEGDEIPVEYEEISEIARGHIASEKAQSALADRVIISDTDLITTTIWSKIMFGKCPEWIEKEAGNRNYDLYLVMSDDVPFVKDEQRYGKGKRQLSLERCLEELNNFGRKFVVIKGNWQERFDKAVYEIEKLMEE
jgi:HTH-type transcriptional repressor of NAD biosynthesis genes